MTYIDVIQTAIPNNVVYKQNFDGSDVSSYPMFSRIKNIMGWEI